MTTATDTTTIEVDPCRLVPGSWSHELKRQVGEGDIHASYSADRIGMGQPLRTPFSHGGYRWVCVGFGPGPVAEAYRGWSIPRHSTAHRPPMPRRCASTAVGPPAPTPWASTTA